MSQTTRNAWQVTKTLFLRLRFIFVFIVIAVVVGKWDYIMAVADKWLRPKAASDGGVSEFEWFCPMHPSVVRNDDKAKCPICGMPLSNRKRGEVTPLPPGVDARLQLSPLRIRQAGVATEEIGYRTLVQELRTVGRIEWDERKLSRITARVAGRADELLVNFMGARIKKGDPMYKIYSPDLVTTQEEHLLALKAWEEQKVRENGSAGAAGRTERLLDSTRERLKLWGVTDEQIKELEKSRKVETHLTLTSPASGIVVKKEIHAGQQIMMGDNPFTIVDDSAVWMQAEVFERDLGLVKEGQIVEITSEAYPGESFTGKAAFVASQIEAETRTVKVRVDVENPKGRLKSGMYVTAILRIPLGKQGEIFYGC